MNESQVFTCRHNFESSEFSRFVLLDKFVATNTHQNIASLSRYFLRPYQTAALKPNPFSFCDKSDSHALAVPPTLFTLVKNTRQNKQRQKRVFDTINF